MGLALPPAESCRFSWTRLLFLFNLLSSLFRLTLSLGKNCPDDFIIQVRYKSDCEELYGVILDNHNVVSSTEGALKEETERAWKMMYPDEPYEMDPTKALPNDNSEHKSGVEKCTKYDLVNAVKRQSSFFYQVRIRVPYNFS